ncbi:hypothetical protein LCGC14_1744580 [marine sediment metagenome]|uniref:Polyprenyl synthetase n=1 Tax=marine sediment metagenome TaxID=412755 RepID=A0A0F9H5L9_9ZZZZ
MNFSKYIKKYVPKINSEIKLIWENKQNNTNNLFLKEYYAELQDFFLSGGKRIRPLLTIATYNAFEAEPDEKIILPSVGIEFLHNASLIHDDIIDKDEFRRGKPTFHFRFINYHKKHNLKKMSGIDFGNSTGIIGGDTSFLTGLEAYLFNNFARDLNLNAINLYKNAFIEIANGVLIELDMINQKNLTISDYINMIGLKTGALIEKAILIGANYANIGVKFNNELSTYGKNLGIIFQITDDILGTFGDENVTGKGSDGDIREGKKTCLLITALNSLDNSKKNRLNKLIENSEISNDDVIEVKELFREANVIDSCKHLADSYYQEARTSLDHLKSEIRGSEAEFFENILDFVVKRDF